MITQTTATPRHRSVATDDRAPDERDWLLTAGGAALCLLALSKRSTIGAAVLVGGGYWLYRSLPNGTLPGLLPDSLESLKAKLADARLKLVNAQARQNESRDWYPPEDADFVEESSMDSFPASDPPARY